MSWGEGGEGCVLKHGAGRARNAIPVTRVIQDRIGNCAVKIINLVMPIIEVEFSHAVMSYKRLLGTGFVLDQGNRFVTAKHVVQGAATFVAFETVDRRFVSVDLRMIATHPKEDFAVFELNPPRPGSGLKLDSTPQNSSLKYDMWGYPEDFLFESDQRGAHGAILPRPELIYTAGYIRRRVSHSLLGLPGNCFYELSSIAGSGSSGGPIIEINRSTLHWHIFGIYIGERTIEVANRPPREIAYAARIDADVDFFRDNGCEVL